MPGERIIIHGISKVYHGSLADPVLLEDYEAELAAQEKAQLEDHPPEESEDEEVEQEQDESEGEGEEESAESAG